MNLLVLQELLKPCRGDDPVGQNLEYSPLFLRMMNLSARQPELQYGDTLLAAHDPDWQQLFDSAIEVAQQTRDLRVAVQLVDSLCRISHWSGLADGLELVSHWTCNFWDSIHPQLDPFDHYDPTARLSALAFLTHDDQLIRGVLDLPLAAHRSLGLVTVREFRILNGTAEQDTTVGITRCQADAIFRSVELEHMEQQLAAVMRCRHAVECLDRFLISEVGSAAWSSRPLLEMLAYSQQTMQAQIQRRFDPTVSSSFEKHPCHEQTQATFVTMAAPSIVAVDIKHAALNSFSSSQVGPSALRVQSRTEASAALDDICLYFETKEPASPVPLLLQRAKRLIPMSFIDILRELSPNEVPQLMQHLVGFQEAKR